VRAPSPAPSEPLPCDQVTDLADPTDGLVQRVLIVEDDDGDALLVEALLDDAFPGQTDVVRARTLVEAVRLLEGDGDGRAPQSGWCVLVDLGLPDASGFEALHGIRAVVPFDPVVVLTGLADDATGLAAVAAGAQDYLVKGRVEAEALRRSVRYAVERCRADDAARQLLEEKLLQQENVRLERGLLPSPLLEQHIDLPLTARYRPGSNRLRIGGDFYDVVERDGVVHVVVGDVCGHGPDEAAIGVVLRVAWRALVRAGLSPPEVMAHLDDLMAVEALSPGQFTTLASLRLLPGGEVGVVLAGHPAPLVVDDEGVRPLDGPGGPVLGVMPAPVWEEHVHHLAPGARVLAYTDGLIEGRAEAGRRERLGGEGAAAIVRDLAGRHGVGPELLDALLAEVEQRHGGALDDDVALLLVGLPGAGSVGAGGSAV
jgi:serine phosphatase RsbU (regulator of sigma subunit)